HHAYLIRDTVALWCCSLVVLLVMIELATSPLPGPGPRLERISFFNFPRGFPVSPVSTSSWRSASKIAAAVFFDTMRSSSNRTRLSGSPEDHQAPQNHTRDRTKPRGHR